MDAKRNNKEIASESEDCKKPNEEETYEFLSKCFTNKNVKSMYKMIQYVQKGDISANHATKLLHKLDGINGTSSIQQKLIELGAQKTPPAQPSDAQ